MSDTEMLSLIEHYRWRVEPLSDGGWCIDGPDGRGRYTMLALTRDSLRDALRQAMRRQADMALGRPPTPTRGERGERS